MSERTLVLIKPDGVRRGLTGEVLARIERKGLRLVAMDLRTVGKDLAETHYAEHVAKPFYRLAGGIHHVRPAGRPGGRGAAGNRGVPRTGRRDGIR